MIPPTMLFLSDSPILSGAISLNKSRTLAMKSCDLLMHLPFEINNFFFSFIEQYD